MDQFVVTYEGFDLMLTQELKKGGRPDVVIQKNPFFAVMEEEVRIAKLAESKGLRVFQNGLLGISEISSEQLQQRIDERKAKTLKQIGD